MPPARPYFFRVFFFLGGFVPSRTFPEKKSAASDAVAGLAFFFFFFFGWRDDCGGCGGRASTTFARFSRAPRV